MSRPQDQPIPPQDVPLYTTRAPVQAVAAGAGWFFLVLGALGFIPGLVTEYELMTFLGENSGARLFGVFLVSVLHNALHLAYGAAGLLLARRAVGARGFLLGGGLLYLLLAGYGALVDPASTANVLPVNAAGNWLHLTFGLVMVALGVVFGRHLGETAD
ncbi:protein of unknown function [Amycolatopsis arida]|uniref:DUF4383 domain-containing protein n=1 Tax=Amycolatopsis arida TaxID=587909 RepID=A0A1I5QYV3_9PSEU|nr:DUF4383 domain-containing protein [Amycolatopsis arida]TDX99009.1 uncharacterized protein DUF4383 [Amycolatopsis arida]SFP51231.1 protein of unknown function [Amycolatopsis arida]